ncbi:MAG: hypothetical protein C4576_21715 [Desulfobacteraceae bacterium]|nr:MAG: hypothetical protein C4576_21715 [Desulfobacteraceae bacterium]
MMCRDFLLQPYPGKGLSIPIDIKGSIERSFDRLSISYQLQGKLQDILIPEVEKTPSRRSGLWEGTCFELFLAREGSNQYREFNLSPAGHWNVFSFSDYRQSMREEKRYQSLPFRVQKTENSFLLRLNFHLDEKIRERNLDAGVSAVIKTSDGKSTYWSLAHTAARPDFHARDSFIISLPNSR